MSNTKEELVQTIMNILPEITIKQFYVSSINKCFNLSGETKIILNLNDLELLEENQLLKILRELNKIHTTIIKVRLSHKEKEIQLNMFDAKKNRPVK